VAEVLDEVLVADEGDLAEVAEVLVADEHEIKKYYIIRKIKMSVDKSTLSVYNNYAPTLSERFNKS